MNRVNNPKNKISQLFCKHKNKDWYKLPSKSGYSSLRGDTRYLICEDCGKVITKVFYEYEGIGYK